MALRASSWLLRYLAAGGLFFVFTVAAQAGSIFVTGHDPDFHAQAGNTIGAQHIIQDSLTYARNGNTLPILLLQTSTANNSLGDHLNSEQGLIDSGYTASSLPGGNHYVKVSASAFASTNLSLYSALFIPSDHGGSLTGDDLEALDNRSADIISYLNAGGGLVALAEDGSHTPTTDHSHPQLFGFLPFLVTSTALSEAENGNTLTAEGSALGLTTSDINGNFSHNIFTSTGGMTVVDRDSGQQILSLDFRGEIGPGGVTPEPSSLTLLGMGALGIVGYAWRRRKGTLAKVRSISG